MVDCRHMRIPPRRFVAPFQALGDSRRFSRSCLHIHGVQAIRRRYNYNCTK